MASPETVCVLTDSLKFFEYMVTGCSKFKSVILKVVDPKSPGILATYLTCASICASSLRCKSTTPLKIWAITSAITAVWALLQFN